MATTFVSIGSSSTIASNTVTITVPAGGVPAGSQIIVGLSTLTNPNPLSSSVMDTASNVYGASLSGIPNGGSTFNGGLNIFRSRTGGALVNGDTITIPLVPGIAGAVATAYYITGLEAAAPDVSASATGSSANPSVTSPVPNSSGEAFLAFVSGLNSALSFTQDASWGSPPGQVSIGTPLLVGGTVVNAGSGALTYAPLLGTSDTWAAGIIGLLPASLEHESVLVRYSPSRLRVTVYNHGCELSGPAPQPTTNTYFTATFRPTAFPVPVYNHGADQSGPLPTQPETNPHFLARFRPAAYSRFAYNYGSEQPLIVEANPHFLGRYTPVTLRRFFYNTREYGSGPAPLAQGSSSSLSVVVYDVPRPSVAQSASLYYQRADQGVSNTASETNVNFIGRFKPPAYSSFRYNSGSEFSQPAGAQPETNISFLAKFRPVVYTRCNFNCTDVEGTAAAPPDVPVNFIGKFHLASYGRFSYNYSGSDGSTPSVSVVPGSSNLTVVVYDVPRPSLVGAMVSYYWSPAQDRSAPSPPAPDEPNTHFFARFRQVQHSWFRYNSSRDDTTSAPVQSGDSNTHFVPPFTASRFFPQPKLSQDPNAANPPQPETNVGFVGRFYRPKVQLLQALWNNQATDDTIVVPQGDNNPHFVGRFVQPTFSRFAFNYGSEQDGPPPPPVVETNTSFVGSFVPTRYTAIPMYYQGFENNVVLPPIEPNAAFASSSALWRVTAWDV